MALFMRWLFKEGKRDQDYYLNIYCLTTEEWYQHRVHQLKPNPKLWHLCAWQRLFIQASLSFLFFFFHQQPCGWIETMLSIVNQTRMYLSSQSQMLYLIQLCLFISLEGFNRWKLGSCNKLDKQTRVCVCGASFQNAQQKWRGRICCLPLMRQMVGLIVVKQPDATSGTELNSFFKNRVVFKFKNRVYSCSATGLRHFQCVRLQQLFVFL